MSLSRSDETRRARSPAPPPGVGEIGPADRADIEAHGLTPTEVERQLALLRNPPPPTRLLRPCTPGAGVQILSEADVAACLEAHEEAAAAGRIQGFVPASGAASRMFRSLEAERAAGSGDLEALERRAAAGEATAREAIELVHGLDRLALFSEIAPELSRRGVDPAEVLAGRRIEALFSAMLDPDGLDLTRRPKGLLPFHRYPDGVRTAFEEHLLDLARFARGADGRVRAHFTVAPSREAAFRELLERLRRRHEARLDVRYEVGFSSQSPATDTIAIDPEGRLFRRSDGRLLFRPGGHGALISNLNDLGGDLVLVRNIDNVVPDPLKPVVVHWKRVLAGRLVRLERSVHAVLADLERDPTAGVRAGCELLERELQAEIPDRIVGAGLAERAGWLRDRLERPIRVCGVVRCEGDPGGAPFWIAEESGESSPQIVETAQIDLADPAQREIHRSATHFNPVDLACAVRDRHGRPFDLRRFVDPRAVFITRKSSEGRPLLALEHPGLWNGAMARWTTLFVEVPAETFHPVKTINDLLRPDHQPTEDGAA